MAEGVRRLFERYVRALAALDFQTLEALTHPDFELYYPQSGERFRGFAKLRAQLEGYPGGLQRPDDELEFARVIGDDERWVIAPNYTVIPLAGPETYTTIGRAVYGDGSRWWVVSLMGLEDGRIRRTETYFAPDFPAPEWRSHLVEPPDGG